MILAIYAIFGMLFSLVICGFLKPQFVFSRRRCYNLTPTFYLSSKTAYFPWIVFLFFAFIIFAVFREIDFGGIGGNDTIHFQRHFENAYLPLTQFLHYQQFEPLYGLFVWLIRQISSDFRFFLTIYYLIIFAIQVKILSKIKITKITIITYFSICFILILISFSMMRGILALFLTWFAYTSLNDKKYIKSLAWITVATLIHFAAAICYPVWLLCYLSDRKRFSLKRALIYWCFLFGLTFFLGRFVPNFLFFIDTRFYFYFDEDFNIGFNTFIGRSYLILLVIFRFNVLMQHNQMNRIMFIVLLSNLLVLPLQIVLPIMYRMLLMADLAVFFLIPELFHAYQIRQKEYKEYFFSIAVHLSLFFYLFWGVFGFIRRTMIEYGLDNYSNILFS